MVKNEKFMCEILPIFFLILKIWEKRIVLSEFLEWGIFNFASYHFWPKKWLSENHTRSHSTKIIDFKDPFFLTNYKFWYKYHQNRLIGSKVMLFLRYWLFRFFTSLAVIATFCVKILWQFLCHSVSPIIFWDQTYLWHALFKVWRSKSHDFLISCLNVYYFYHISMALLEKKSHKIQLHIVGKLKSCRLWI